MAEQIDIEASKNEGHNKAHGIKVDRLWRYTQRPLCGMAPSARMTLPS
jgi:hypothetical protein